MGRPANVADRTISWLLEWTVSATKLRRQERTQTRNEISFSGKSKMPIGDERRRFCETKAMSDAKLRSTVATEGGLGLKGGVQ